MIILNVTFFERLKKVLNHKLIALTTNEFETLFEKWRSEFSNF